VSWIKTTLGEYYDVRDGTHDSPKYVKEGYPLVTSKNLKNGKIDLTKVKFISEKDYKEINKRSAVEAGDVLMAMIGTIGKPVEIIEPPLFAIKNVALFKTNEKQSSAYLKYFLSHPSTIAKMMKDAKGASQMFVGLGYLRKFPITIPPLEEQLRIVNNINKAFEQIQYIKNQITEEGKLIIDLKKSIISKYTKNDDKTNFIWESSPLKDLCAKYKNDIVDGPFGSNLKTNDFKDEGIPVLKIQHVKQFKINYSKPTFISHQKYGELRRHSFRKGDIVLTKLGKPLGAASVVKEINEGIIVADLVRIRIDPKKLNNDFLCFQLNSSHIQKKINSLSKGATRPRIKLDVIRNLKINYPHLEQQKEIAAKLNILLKQISKYIKINEDKSSQLELLKLSILRKFLMKK